jgi:hypothetical protein
MLFTEPRALTRASEQIPPTPLCQRGARGDFIRLTAYVNSIGANPESSNGRSCQKSFCLL